MSMLATVAIAAATITGGCNGWALVEDIQNAISVRKTRNMCDKMSLEAQIAVDKANAAANQAASAAQCAKESADNAAANSAAAYQAASDAAEYAENAADRLSAAEAILEKLKTIRENASGNGKTPRDENGKFIKKDNKEDSKDPDKESK